MADAGSPEFPQWLKDGWAFILAIIGWVWHAGRLASKVEVLDKKIEDHLEDEEKWRKEEMDRNQREHERIMNSLDRLSDDYHRYNREKR